MTARRAGAAPGGLAAGVVSRVVPVVLTVVVTVVAGAATGGCAGGPPTVDPGGVDGLTVPTPSPEPRDFVDGVDNPWFPLVPGTVRTYRATGGDGRQRITVSVTGRTRLVQGVTTTVVRDRVTGARGRLVEATHHWYAQDRAGNVWYFGEDTRSFGVHGTGQPGTEGSWEAGVDGAEAGLAMPADPRIGDGYAREHLAGVAEDRVEVLALDETRAVPAGTFGGLLQTRDTTPLEPGRAEWRFYARGLGVVLEETVAGGAERVELLSARQP